MSAPPRPAEQILRRLAGHDPGGASIVGDLHEEYLEYVRNRGRLRAGLWYWTQLLRTGVAYRRPVRGVLDRRRQDVAYALRGLRREPGFAGAVVGTLALAMGAGTAIFSVVDGVVLRPLPFEEPEALVRIWARSESSSDAYVDLMYTDGDVFRAGMGSLSDLSMLSVAPRTMLDERGEDPLDLTVARTSIDFFRTLGVTPALGRAYDATDAEAGDRVALISHELWTDRFGQDRNVLGRMVHLNSRGYTIVGVLPPRVAYPYDADVWRALDAGELEDDDREAQLVGRLAQGATLAVASAEAAAVAAALASEQPESHAELTAWLQPLQTTVVRDVSLALYALLAAVGVVLLIACVNTANLLLARAARRSHEVAVRTALGASRGRIVWSHLTESLLLAALGGVAGVLLGRWVLSAMLTVSPELPRMEWITLDARVIAVMSVVTALAGVMFGVGPALHAAAAPPGRSLRDASRSSTVGGRRLRLQSTLVTTEIALSTVLAFAAILLFTTFRSAITFDRGFAMDNLVSVTVDPMHPPEDGDERRAYFGEIAERIGRIPGVRAVGMSSHELLQARGFRVPVTVEGQPTPVPTPQAWVNIVSPDFFDAAGIARTSGTSFGPDGGTEGDAELIVNERFVAAHLSAPGEGVGSRLTLDWLEGRVVGVVRDLSTGGAGEPALPKVYVSTDRVTLPAMAVLVRTIDDPRLLLPGIEREIRAVSSDVLLEDITIVEDVVRSSTAPQRFNMLLVTAFAALALTLAAVGIYGVTSFSVATRRSEIGIRRALGASDHRVAGEVVRRIAGLTAVGVGLGTVGALASGRLLAGLLFGVSPTSPVVVAQVVAVLAATATVAGMVPVVRAVRVDPTGALRGE